MQIRIRIVLCSIVLFLQYLIASFPMQAIALHDSLVQQQPLEINCTRRTLSLRHVLKINESDPKTLQLRIPKKSERVEDVVLASGYKSKCKYPVLISRSIKAFSAGLKSRRCQKH